MYTRHSKGVNALPCEIPPFTGDQDDYTNTTQNGKI